MLRVVLRKAGWKTKTQAFAGEELGMIFNITTQNWIILVLKKAGKSVLRCPRMFEKECRGEEVEDVDR